MTEKRISFGGFDFPVEKGLEYLTNDRIPKTDFLIINDPADSFSMTFEENFPIFTVPQRSDRDYCLFELKRTDRVIKFFCPEKHKNLDAAVWYFYVQIFKDDGQEYVLPGQVRVAFEGDALRLFKGKLKFIELLEKIELQNSGISV